MFFVLYLRQCISPNNLGRVAQYLLGKDATMVPKRGAICDIQGYLDLFLLYLLTVTAIYRIYFFGLGRHKPENVAKHWGTALLNDNDTSKAVVRNLGAIERVGFDGAVSGIRRKSCET